MWQLPGETLPIKGILASSYLFLKTYFLQLRILLAAFFIWLTLPYIYLSWHDYIIIEKLTGADYIKFGSLSFIYLAGVFLIYGSVFHQTYLLMHQHHKPVGFSLFAVLRRLPWLMIALIIASITNLLGYALLVLPGIYLITVITLYYPLIIIDNLNPIDGYKKALLLIWNNWWRTSFVLAVPLLFSFLLMIGATVLAARMEVIFGIDPVIMHFVYTFIQIIATLLFLPISATVTLLQINDLKLRRQPSKSANNAAQPDLTIANG